MERKDKESKEGGEVLGHDRIVIPLPRIEGFFPARRAQAPFAPGLEPDAAQVVPARGGEIKELARQHACLRLQFSWIRDGGEGMMGIRTHQPRHDCRRPRARRGSIHRGKTRSWATARRARVVSSALHGFS